MSELNDREFQTYLDAAERGEALPAGLPAEDTQDLELAQRLFAQQVAPGTHLAAAVQRTMATAPSAPRVSLLDRLSVLKRRIPMSVPRMPLWKRVALSLAAVALVFALTMVAFPSARAAVLEAITKIGGILFIEFDHYPESPTERQGGSMVLIDYDPSSPPGDLLPETRVPLAELQGMLPFTLTVPSWAPAGYTLAPAARVWLPTEAYSGTFVMLTWEAAGQPPVSLSTLYRINGDQPHLRLVGTGGVQEVQVGGQPAALVRGGWDADTKAYVDAGLLFLEWEHDGLVYTLSSQEGPVSVEDLIHMAESMH